MIIHVCVYKFKYWVYTYNCMYRSLLMGNSKAFVAMVFLLGISDNTTDLSTKDLDHVQAL